MMSKKGITIKGDGNVIGDYSQSRVTKISTQTENDVLETVITEFIKQVKENQSLSKVEKKEIENKAREFEITLKLPELDLGKIQKFKQFLIDKGGWVATTGLALFNHPSIRASIEAATKKLFE